MADPIHRVAARVLPVNDAGEVLLLQGQDPAHPGDLHWVSVGGAVDPGESLTAAGVRELLEETGVVLAEDALIGPVHRVSHPFSWAGVAYLSDNHFFAVPLGAPVEIHFGGLEEAEIGNILQAQWWTPEKLRQDGAAASQDLPDIMVAAIEAVLGGAR